MGLVDHGLPADLPPRVRAIVNSSSHDHQTSRQGPRVRYRPWLCLATLLTLLALGTDVHTQPRAGKPPIGNVEQVDARGKVTGWSADEDRPSAPVEVVVTVDGADVDGDHDLHGGGGAVL